MDSNPLRFIGFRGGVETPGWYGPIRTLHYYGSQCKTDMKRNADEGDLEPDDLEKMGYAKIEDRDDGKCLVHVTERGEEALSQFRDQQLRYSSTHVVQIVSFLVAASAGAVSLSVGLEIGLNGALVVLAVLALFYIVGAITIECTLDPIHTKPDNPVNDGS